MKGNKNINKSSVPFSKDNNPMHKKDAKEKRKKTLTDRTKRKRELIQLLGLPLKGKFGGEINKSLKDALGLKAETLEEALHVVQIAKAISSKDTQAYSALMQTAGLNKPIKVDATTNGESLNPQFNYSLLSTEELLTLRKLTQKCAT